MTPPDDRYKLLRRQAGLKGYPTPRERKLAYRKIHEERLVSDNALRFGHSPETGRLAHVMPEDLATGMHIIGASETGKTNGLKCIDRQLMAHRDRTGQGFSVIDPAGPLARHLLDLCVSRGEAFADNVVYFSLRDICGYVPLFNPLRQPKTGTRDERIAFATRSFIEAVMRVRGVASTLDNPQINELLEKMLKVILYNDLSLVESEFLVSFGEDEQRVMFMLLEVVEPYIRAFWEKAIAPVGSPKRREELAPATRRFETFFQFPQIKRMVGHTLAGIDVAEMMDRGQIGIFDLGLDGTELTQEAARLIGSLLVQQFKDAAMRRPPNVSLPHFLVIDEFSNFVSADVMTVFDQARQRGLRVLLAHQGMDQLLLPDQDPRLLKAVLRIRQKLIFGAGLVSDQLDLAQQAYAPWIDTDQVRLELKTKYFAPKGKWVEIENRTTVDSDVDSDSEQRAHGSGGMSGAGIVTPLMGDPTKTEHAGTFDSAIYGRGSARAKGRAEALTRSKQHITEFEEREQTTNVQFEEADNLIFKKMQDSFRQPTGTCTHVTGKDHPELFQFELDPGVPGITEEATSRFLLRMCQPRPTMYMLASESLTQIEQRRIKLIEAAPPDQPRVVPTPREEPAAPRRQKPYRTKKKP